MRPGSRRWPSRAWGPCRTPTRLPPSPSSPPTGALPAARGVKGQLVGPATLAASLQVEGAPASEHPALVAALRRRVAARAAWQAEALAVHGLPVLVVLDEPVLGLDGAGPSAAAIEGVSVVLQAIRDAGAMAGLHTCAPGKLPWPALCPDLWSLDLHGRGGPLPEEFHKTLADGAYLAAGLVPTMTDLSLSEDLTTLKGAAQRDPVAQEDPAAVPDPATLVDTWLATATAVGDVASLAARTLVAATCGLAGLDVCGAEASFTRAAEVAQRIRTLAAAIG